MALVRFNVNVSVGGTVYAPGDEVDLPKEWETILLEGGHVEKVLKKDATPEAKKDVPEDLSLPE